MKDDGAGPQSKVTDSDSSDSETAELAPIVSSDTQQPKNCAVGAVNGKCTLSLLSGESLSVPLHGLASCLRAADIPARLEIARPLRDQHEYRVLIGSDLLGDCDPICHESLESMSIVVTIAAASMKAVLRKELHRQASRRQTRGLSHCAGRNSSPPRRDSVPTCRAARGASQK